jgi:hypothetical protein
MKKLLSLALVALAASFSSSVFADAAYPYTNPTYIGTAISPAAVYSAPADYTFTTSNVGTAVLQVSGTCTGLVGTVQGSSQVTGAPVWVTLRAYPIVGGASVASVGAAGTWRIDTAGYGQTRLHITALTATCTIGMSGTSAPAIALRPVVDPCLSDSIAKSSAVIAQGASATTKVVDASAGKSIYVCGYSMTAAGTTPTVTITSGTHVSADCDTTAAALTGAMQPSATVGVLSYATPGAVMTTASGFQLCLTTAATTSVAGVLSYVQQ